MRVYIWCDGAAMPTGGPAGAGYVVVGGVHLLGSEALGDATHNVAEYSRRFGTRCGLRRTRARHRLTCGWTLRWSSATSLGHRVRGPST